MNRKTLFHDAILRSVIVVLLLITVPACSKRGGADGKESTIDYWTCTMHPSVHSKDPGKCPICSMDLVPVMKQSGGETPAQVSSPSEQQSKDAEAKPSPSRQGERKIKYYKSTMMAGETSAKPAKDSMGMDMVPVYEDEKPGAANQPSEFVVPVERQQQIGGRYAKAERKPLRGIVQSVPVEQGKNVKIGDMLVEVADLSVVWVWAEFYENELSMLKVGQKFTITAKSYPGEKFEGTLSVINPFLDEMKRTAKVRIDIPNPDFKLQPGMYVNAELEMDMGEALTIPVSAVMPTGTRSVVFVDKGQGKLEPRVVQLGTKYADIYEVKTGLQENERVVASANFLIDAESKVQGALRGFEEERTPQEGVSPGTKP